MSSPHPTPSPYGGPDPTSAPRAVPSGAAPSGYGPTGPGYPPPGHAQGFPAAQGQAYPQAGYPQAGAAQGYPQPGAAQGHPQPGTAQGYSPAGPGHPPGAVLTGPGFGPPAPPPGLAADGRPLAQATDRLLARIVDGLVLLLPNLVIVGVLLVPVVIVGVSVLDAGSDDAGGILLFYALLFAALLIATAVAAALSYWYSVVRFLRQDGQTVGKRWRHIRVVAVDGSPVTRPEARRRWLANEGIGLLGVIPIVGSVTGVYAWIDALWLLWDPSRQCLHDKYAKTVVIDVAGASDPMPGVAAGGTA